MTSIKKEAKSVSLLWLGSLIGSGSTFVIYIVLARELGPESFGLFGSALSIATIFTMLASFGVSQFWLKAFGKDGWDGIKWIAPSIKFTIISMVIALIILYLWAYFGPHDYSTRQMLLILSFFIMGKVSTDLVSSKLQLEERYIKLAIWQLLPNLSRLVILTFFVYIVVHKITVIDVAWMYALIGMIIAGFGILQLLQMKGGIFELKGHGIKEGKNYIVPTVKNVFIEAWPFGMASLFAFVYLQSDIIMVKYIAGDVEAGIYNVAFVILTAIMIFPAVLYQKYFLPKYHRWANNDRVKFYTYYKKGNLAMLISGTVVMVGLLITSGWLLPFVFGNEYQNAVMLTNILAMTIPLYFVAYSVGAALVTQEHMKLKVKLMGSIALVNIFLNVLLIPNFYAKGAAIATLISNLLLLILYFIAAKKVVFNISEKDKHVAIN